MAQQTENARIQSSAVICRRDVARGEWDRLVKILIGMRVLTEADYIALGNLCQAYSTMIDAQRLAVVMSGVDRSVCGGLRVSGQLDDPTANRHP